MWVVATAGVIPGNGAVLVTGASRGLGAALVGALLARGAPLVIGVARTSHDRVAATEAWARDPRYRHVACDLTAPEADEAMTAAVARLPAAPLLVVHNAAAVRSDLLPDGAIDFAAWDDVTRTAIGGLGHVLRATQRHLLTHGGALVGISSFAAVMPPVLDPRVAYPATKAHLDTVLRSLRLAWRGRVRVITVHLGRVGGTEDGWPRRLWHPTYRAAAGYVVARLARPRAPDRIAYTWPYRVVSRYLLPLCPDRVYAGALRALRGRGPR
jgi:NAD(P)-dependent dehydrogenase (short-subunit alcohol dehydrogenase family)